MMYFIVRRLGRNIAKKSHNTTLLSPYSFPGINTEKMLLDMLGKGRYVKESEATFAK